MTKTLLRKKAGVGGRAVARVRIDHGQDAQLLAGRELVVNEVHGPDMLGVSRSNLGERLKGRSKPRGSYRKAEDAELFPPFAG